MNNCYKCGGPGELEIEDGSAVCYDCDADFRAAMEVEFPFGFCPQCGARYHQWTCFFGTVHVVAMHSEGGCSNWRDSGVGPDECSEGCRQPYLPFTNDEYWAMTGHQAVVPAPVFAFVGDDEDLPF